jgi:hypothetical protein
MLQYPAKYIVCFLFVLCNVLACIDNQLSFVDLTFKCINQPHLILRIYLPVNDSRLSRVFTCMIISKISCHGVLPPAFTLF